MYHSFLFPWRMKKDLLDGHHAVTIGFLAIGVDIYVCICIISNGIHITSTTANNTADQSCRDLNFLASEKIAFTYESKGEEGNIKCRDSRHKVCKPRC